MADDSTQAPAPVPGEVDITDLVEQARSAFVSWATDYLFGLAIAQPGWGWLNWFLIGAIVKGTIQLGVTALSKAIVMQGFYLNTALRKAAQADAFVTASAALDALPDSATDEEYENAEKARMDAFIAFVSVSA